MNRPCPTFGHKRAHVPLGIGEPSQLTNKCSDTWGSRGVRQSTLSRLSRTASRTKVERRPSMVMPRITDT
jgi:hypothetical protein